MSFELRCRSFVPIGWMFDESFFIEDVAVPYVLLCAKSNGGLPSRSSIRERRVSVLMFMKLLQSRRKRSSLQETKVPGSRRTLQRRLLTVRDRKKTFYVSSGSEPGCFLPEHNWNTVFYNFYAKRTFDSYRSTVRAVVPTAHKRVTNGYLLFSYEDNTHYQFLQTLDIKNEIALQSIDTIYGYV
jgi:hypothetical protein